MARHPQPADPADPASQPASHRGAEILDLVARAGGSMRITAIAEALNVTEETVRRNVRRLSDKGLVRKVHGGVLMQHGSTELSFAQRMDENPRPKQQIAAHVAGLIGNGSSVFLDIGSTTAFIARALQSHQELLVVTNSVSVANALAARNGNRVFMPGGELRAHDGGVFGDGALEFVRQFRCDFAVLSTAAVNARDGFMLFDLDEARYSREIMANARTRIVAADSSKFGRSAPISLAPPSTVDLLVTNADPPKDIRDAAARWATEIVIAR